jgi:hypothetical protein
VRIQQWNDDRRSDCDEDEQRTNPKNATPRPFSDLSSRDETNRAELSLEELSQL